MSPHSSCIRQLHPTQVLSLAESAPALLTVVDGIVWLTDGDGEDIILAAGDCIELDDDSTPIASALRGLASIEIASTQAAPLAHAA
jgi:hypothetical protein